MQTATYFGLMEVSRETGIPYWRIIYAEQARHLPDPVRIARKRVYTEEDVERIRNYFTQTDQDGHDKK
jgi:DNA-binding transcriptional MerR regulator